MKPEFIDAAIACVALTVGNFVYQFIRGDAANYATAFERSWFQVVAVLMCWVLWRDWK